MYKYTAMVAFVLNDFLRGFAVRGFATTIISAELRAHSFVGLSYVAKANILRRFVRCVLDELAAANNQAIIRTE